MNIKQGINCPEDEPDGLREENLRSKKEKRITGREEDEKKTAGHREQELDFGKVRSLIL